MNIHHIATITAVILLTALCMAPAATVSAETVIHNYSSVEANTGGESTEVDTNSSRAEVRIKTTVNGETVTDIHKTATSGSTAVSIKESSHTDEASQGVPASSSINAITTADTRSNEASLQAMMAQLEQLLTTFSIYAFK